MTLSQKRRKGEVLVGGGGEELHVTGLLVGLAARACALCLADKISPRPYNNFIVGF